MPRPALALAGLLAALAGCSPAPKPAPLDQHGFHLTPPPGWSERVRPADAEAAGKAARGRHQPPLPRLATAGKEERMLVRYDRGRSGRSAWLRVSVAELPDSLTPEASLAGRAPAAEWKRESGVESLEVAGQPAARVAFAGRWSGQDYLCESVAVCKGDRVYFITASFPADDAEAREQVRRSVAGASWK